MTISELESSLSEKDFEKGRLEAEVKTLQEQLKLHAHTMNILVAEKADLSSSLGQSQTTIQQKSGTYVNLKNCFQSLVTFISFRPSFRSIRKVETTATQNFRARKRALIRQEEQRRCPESLSAIAKKLRRHIKSILGHEVRSQKS